MHGQTATLHYAFAGEVRREDIRAYFFTAPLESLTSSGGVQTATFSAPPAPAASPIAVVSAASFLPGPLAPGSIASAFGAQLAGNVSVRDAAGVTRPAQVFYASPLQVNFLIPPETPPGPAAVLIGPASAPVAIAAVAPGLFQSEGWLAATIQRGSAYEPLTSAGVAPGEDVYLALYATGIRHARQVQATLGGRNLPVLYAGPQGGFTGLDQVNIGPLPRSLAARGALTLVVTADGQTANPVELVMR
jgi:uncharacterized protein (TIGR03437 family)